MIFKIKNCEHNPISNISKTITIGNLRDQSLTGLKLSPSPDVKDAVKLVGKAKRANFSRKYLPVFGAVAGLATGFSALAADGADLSANHNKRAISLGAIRGYRLGFGEHSVRNLGMLGGASLLGAIGMAVGKRAKGPALLASIGLTTTLNLLGSKGGDWATEIVWRESSSVPVNS